MLSPLAAGLLSSALLLFIAARASPEWRRRKTLSSGPAYAGGIYGTGGFFALGVFGIALGIPAALGFVRANVLLVLGSLVATMIARRLNLLGVGPLSRDDSEADGEAGDAGQDLPKVAPGDEPAAVAAPRSDLRRDTPYWWFVILAWSILAAGWSAGTLDLRRGLAAQAVLGPAAVSQGSWLSFFLCLGFLAGLVSAVFWATTAPSIEGAAGTKADAWLRWGESALAGAAVSAPYFGPSLGALTLGPSATELRAGAAASYLLTCLVVASVSRSRQMPPIRRHAAVRLVCAVLALAALGSTALVR